MIERRVFKVDTHAISTQLVLRLASMGIPTTMQSIGGFIDTAQTDIASASASYYLARISNGKSATLDYAYMQIHNLVTKKLTTHIPSLTYDQMEKAKLVVMRAIEYVYTQQFGNDVGEWSSVTAMTHTPTEHAIIATRRKTPINEHKENSTSAFVNTRSDGGTYIL